MSQPRRGPKRKHYTVTFEPAVWERWTEIGLCEGFQSDSSVAQFLFSLYSSAGCGQKGKVTEGRCVGCHTVLPLLCPHCLLLSCGADAQSSQAASSTQEGGPGARTMPSAGGVCLEQASLSVPTLSTQAGLSSSAVSSLFSAQSVPTSVQTPALQVLTSSPNTSFVSLSVTRCAQGKPCVQVKALDDSSGITSLVSAAVSSSSVAEAGQWLSVVPCEQGRSSVQSSSVGDGSSQAGSSLQCRPFVQPTVSLQPPSLQASASMQGSVTQGPSCDQDKPSDGSTFPKEDLVCVPVPPSSQRTPLAQVTVHVTSTASTQILSRLQVTATPVTQVTSSCLTPLMSLPAIQTAVPVTQVSATPSTQIVPTPLTDVSLTQAAILCAFSGEKQREDLSHHSHSQQSMTLSRSQSIQLAHDSSGLTSVACLSASDLLHTQNSVLESQSLKVLGDVAETQEVNEKSAEREPTQLLVTVAGVSSVDQDIIDKQNDRHQQEDALKEDAVYQSDQHDHDSAADIPTSGERSASKRKNKDATSPVHKKEKHHMMKTRLKKTGKKTDCKTDLSQDDSRNEKKPANKTLITYEPKTVLGRGKKIGKYYYYDDYVCACCDKTFPGKAEFNKHITAMRRQQERTSRRKYERKQKECPECSQMVELGQAFSQHMKTHTAPKLTCSGCQAKFISKREFARHVKTHRGERPCLCMICGEGFRHSGHLCNHMVTHRTMRAFMCSVCGKTFRSAAILRGHEVTHSGERRFGCQQCGRSFARRHTLNVHTLVHSPVKPFSCDQCPAAFINSTKLRYHRTIHTDPAAFRCEVCSATFRCPTSLRNHRRIHTGEKPCVCSVCHKAFARPAYLRSHLRFHSDEKAYKCKNCPCAFRKRGSLKQHLQAAHAETCAPCATSGSASASAKRVSVAASLIVGSGDDVCG